MQQAQNSLARRLAAASMTPGSNPGITQRLVQFGRSLREAGFTINARRLLADINPRPPSTSPPGRSLFCLCAACSSTARTSSFRPVVRVVLAGTKAGLLMEMGTASRAVRTSRPGAPSSGRPDAGDRSKVAGRRCAVREGDDPSLSPRPTAQDEPLRQKDFGDQRDRVAGAGAGDAEPAVAHGRASDPPLVRTSKQAANLDLPRHPRAAFAAAAKSWNCREAAQTQTEAAAAGGDLRCQGSMERYHACFPVPDAQPGPRYGQDRDLRLRDAADPDHTGAARHGDLDTAMSRVRPSWCFRLVGHPIADRRRRCAASTIAGRGRGEMSSTVRWR